MMTRDVFFPDLKKWFRIPEGQMYVEIATYENSNAYYTSNSTADTPLEIKTVRYIIEINDGGKYIARRITNARLDADEGFVRYMIEEIMKLSIRKN